MCVCRSSFSVAALVCTLSAPFVAERRQLHHCFDPLAADSLLLATFFPKPISLEFIELKFLPTKEAEKKKNSSLEMRMLRWTCAALFRLSTKEIQQRIVVIIKNFLPTKEAENLKKNSCPGLK
jgi:hypothetical protein